MEEGVVGAADGAGVGPVEVDGGGGDVGDCDGGVEGVADAGEDIGEGRGDGGAHVGSQ